MALAEDVVADLWRWIHEFVTVPNEFYGFKFAPCPYAHMAVRDSTVDVVAWESGDVRTFIREQAIVMRDAPRLTTRVMGFPPRTRFAWGISEFVEQLNAELIPDDVFLNTGIAKTTTSRYPGSDNSPYFIVVANSLTAVLDGAESLARSDYYKDWPREHYEIVVER
ncbi:MAG: hypothetical protein KDC98_12225, partial [Planctomycetes bacterium]|nr:hypothetical protein [Planctomycetota bacterium]